jgi:hypothetical protein
MIHMERIYTWGNDRRTVQVWRLADGQFRAVALLRIGESSRYREIDSATHDALADALALALDWEAAWKEAK